MFLVIARMAAKIAFCVIKEERSLEIIVGCVLCHDD